MTARFDPFAPQTATETKGNAGEPRPALVLLLLLFVSGHAWAGQYVGISAVHPTGSTSISADGLVAAYDMETLTADGRLRDFSGNGNHGTFTRAALVKGLFGKARRFSSVEDRIALASNPTFNIKGPLSIAIWVRIRQLGLHQHMVACDNRFAYWFTQENRLRFVDSMTHGLMTNWTVAKDKWYSLVGVFQGTEGDILNSTNIRAYVNGQVVDGAIQGVAWGRGELFPTDACYIGFESHQGAKSHKALFLDGDIDELLIFSRAMAEPEIKAHATR